MIIVLLFNSLHLFLTSWICFNWLPRLSNAVTSLFTLMASVFLVFYSFALSCVIELFNCFVIMDYFSFTLVYGIGTCRNEIVHRVRHSGTECGYTLCIWISKFVHNLYDFIDFGKKREMEIVVIMTWNRWETNGKDAWMCGPSSYHSFTANFTINNKQ